MPRRGLCREHDLDCEVKIQVGLGVLVAGTWMPKKSFGFQYGKGYEIGTGGLKTGSVHWSKSGSDGSMSEELEGSFGTALASWERSVERQIYPAEHEPIGTWPWMVNALGCGGEDGTAKPRRAPSSCPTSTSSRRGAGPDP